jgi:hypothetical protein
VTPTSPAAIVVTGEEIGLFTNLQKPLLVSSILGLIRKVTVVASAGYMYIFMAFSRCIEIPRLKFAGFRGGAA